MLQLLCWLCTCIETLKIVHQCNSPGTITKATWLWAGLGWALTALTEITRVPECVQSAHTTPCAPHLSAYFVLCLLCISG